MVDKLYISNSLSVYFSKVVQCDRQMLVVTPFGLRGCSNYTSGHFLLNFFAFKVV